MESTRHDEPLTVLVVDDEKLSATLASRYIEAAGHRVLTASDGEAALRIMLDEGPQLLVTDWEMPKMGGLELCRAVRDNDTFSYVFILVLTAHSDEDRIVEAFDAGADDYLSKPFGRKELLARLRAGVRIVKLQQDLDRRRRDIHRANAEMEIANQKLARANQRLNELATTDELTGLTNRREALRLVDEYWAASKRHGTPLSCVMIDIDHFKRFNDTHGHAVGDLVLKETANILVRSARTEERVCRLGGEEYLLLAPNATEAMAVAGAERLRSAVENQVVRWGAAELQVTISLGVAQRTAPMGRPDELLKLADDALYVAKSSGRNCVRHAGETALLPVPKITSTGTSFEIRANNVKALGNQLHRVLVAEDEPFNRKVCESILSHQGYMVDEASTCEEALVNAGRTKYEVYVVSTSLVDGNGVSCAALIKEQMRDIDVPILAICPNSSKECKSTALDAGADQVIVRPVDEAGLLRHIESMALRSRQGADLELSNEVRGEQSRIMTLLLDFSRDLTTADSLAVILDRTVAVTSQLTCCRRISIMMPDDDMKTLRIVRAIGMDEGVVERIHVPIGMATAGKVFETGKVVVVNDSDDWFRRNDRYESDLFVSGPMVSSALSSAEKVVGVLNITERAQSEPFQPHELEAVDLISNLAASAIHACQSRMARDDARDSIVVAMAKLAEYRDTDTGKHLDRVARFCVLLGHELRTFEHWRGIITDEFLVELEKAVPLHDIGKVAVPDYILNKPGRLDEEETRIMRTHADIGAATLRSVVERAHDVHFLEMATDIAQYHHEWYNGKGYPKGIQGDQIPPAARIAAVADVYDALTTKRVYKDAMPHEKAASIIYESSGKQFDPDVVKAFGLSEHIFKRLSAELADDCLVRSCWDRNQPVPISDTPVSAS